MPDLCARCGKPFPPGESAEVICPECASTMMSTGASESVKKEDPLLMKLKEGYDYYYDDSGLMVFTEGYLTRRGYCCDSGCQNCPY